MSEERCPCGQVADGGLIQARGRQIAVCKECGDDFADRRRAEKEDTHA